LYALNEKGGRSPLIITPEISTIITGVIGIFISVFTAYLTHKVKQRDEEMRQYRKEREEREAEQIRRRESEDQSRDQLTLGMARTMLLSNYDRAVDKGFYSVTERDVYHELFEAYVGAGGNGVIRELAEKIVDLPTEPKGKQKGD
jgi:hypothetical protein